MKILELNFAMIRELFKMIDPAEEFIIIGSTVLKVFDMLDESDYPGDLDILVEESFLDKLLTDMPNTAKEVPIEIGRQVDWNSLSFFSILSLLNLTVSDIIKRRLYYLIHDGTKILNFDTHVAWMKKRGKEKDLRRLDEIEKRLKAIKLS